METYLSLEEFPGAVRRKRAAPVKGRRCATREEAGAGVGAGCAEEESGARAGRAAPVRCASGRVGEAIVTAGCCVGAGEEA
ncbi:hypothetical protein E2562_026092 [Oryza meyeriana var. granulata]|uniref:DUF834 domain-containing protein n=1 Tax=Oryza meyeriana var. granulata TaxID=110450 RepID=A0A6G1EYX7_9ORYZ|nr:hypothetical protein E2562_026092 [Oryza meyeriana var. granulata]